MTIQAERVGLRRANLRVDLARILPSLVLVGYGIFILSLLARGIMTLYINPAYVWSTTLAGGVLIGLAVIRLVRRPETACEDDCDDCSTASPTKLWPYAVLSIPLLLAILVPPHSLAAFSALQRGPQAAGLVSIRGATTVHRVSLSVDTRSFTLQDWVGALSADPNPKDYSGKPIVLTGIVIHDTGSAPPGYIMVLRYQVTCCIADARPIGLIVRDTSHGALKDNQWVTVTGKMGAASYQGQQIAVVEPRRISPTKAGNPYMY